MICSKYVSLSPSFPFTRFRLFSPRAVATDTRLFPLCLTIVAQSFVYQTLTDGQQYYLVPLDTSGSPYAPRPSFSLSLSLPFGLPTLNTSRSIELRVRPQTYTSFARNTCLTSVVNRSRKNTSATSSRQHVIVRSCNCPGMHTCTREHVGGRGRGREI